MAEILFTEDQWRAAARVEELTEHDYRLARDRLQDHKRIYGPVSSAGTVMDQIQSRTAINADARLAAERFIASGAQPVNPYVEGTDAFLCWATDYRRWVHTLQADEDTETSA